jgi:hypothetical protein
MGPAAKRLAGELATCNLKGGDASARDEYQLPAKHLVQEVADSFTTGDFHIKVRMLLVAHPELNSVEMVWGNIKRKATSTNLTFKLSDVEKYMAAEVAQMTAVKLGIRSSHNQGRREISVAGCSDRRSRGK